MAQIFAKIALDTSDLEGGLRRAKKRMDGFKSAAIRVGGVIGAAFSARQIKRWAAEFDRFGKIAKRLNTDAESIQRMGFAASQSGSNLETITNAMTSLARRASDFTNSGIVEAFKALNINQEQFAKLTPEKQLQKLADGFKSAEDRGEAFRALQTLLEEQFRELVPLLEQGGAAIAATMDEASVATNAQVDAMTRLNDEIGRLEQGLVGPKAALTAMAADALATLRAVDEMTKRSDGGSESSPIRDFIRKAYENTPNARIGEAISNLFTADALNAAFNPDVYARQQRAEAAFRNRSGRGRNVVLSNPGDEYGPEAPPPAVFQTRLFARLSAAMQAVVGRGKQLGYVMPQGGPMANALAAGMGGMMGGGGQTPFAGRGAIADSMAALGGGGNVNSGATRVLQIQKDSLATLKKSLDVQEDLVQAVENSELRMR